MSTVEKVREIIRAEVARARPIEDSRRAIELIAESSVRFRSTDAEPRIEVVDGAGEPRLHASGRAFALQDLVAELRASHPTLFEPLNETPEPLAEPAAPALGTARPATPAEASQPKPGRDWLVIDGARAEPRLPPASPVGVEAKPLQALSAPALVPVKAPAEAPAARVVPMPVASPSGPPRAPQAGNGSAAPRPPLPRSLVAASAIVATILSGGALGFWLTRPTAGEAVASIQASPSPPAPAQPAPAQSIAARPADPPATGSVKPPPAAESVVRGVPEVIDTATLSINGKVMPLFGVEWVRGAGDPADLTNYLRKREVSCRPAANEASSYRCEIEGQDLSKVVLYNGGGRATSTATPDLQAAEAHAKAARIGLWGR